MKHALEQALIECQLAREAHMKPKRADINQLTGRYVFDHIEMVLIGLIKYVEENGL